MLQLGLTPGQTHPRVVEAVLESVSGLVWAWVSVWELALVVLLIDKLPAE